MTLGRFGGAAPRIKGVSAYVGSPESGPDGLDQATGHRIGNPGDLPIAYRDVGARVFNSAAISIPNDTSTVLTFNSERWDTDGIHSTSTNTSRLTCNTAGKYLVFTQARFDSNTTGFRRLRIRVNDATDFGETRTMTIVGEATLVIASTVVDLAVGDYVETYVQQNSGGSLDVGVSSNISPEFMMQRVTP